MTTSFWNRLKQGLKKTSQSVENQLRTVFKSHKVTPQTLEDLEDILLQSDVGVKTTEELKEAISNFREKETIDFSKVQELLANKLETILKPHEKELFPSSHPFVILTVGVNGTGKTTSIPKITQWFLKKNLKVEWAACDTFRAAAVEQLSIWAERLNIFVYKTKEKGDAASLAYDAVSKAKEKGTDVLIIDTAGRLHNKQNLMAELKKVYSVIKKILPEAPHETIIVLDATTGNNAHQQVKAFQEIIPLTGIVMTKLDGTAKGGVLISIAESFKLPIYGIGVGESMDDFYAFKVREFSRGLLGLGKDKNEF